MLNLKPIAQHYRTGRGTDTSTFPTGTIVIGVGFESECRANHRPPNKATTSATVIRFISVFM
jgi:hypothetical protein